MHTRARTQTINSQAMSRTAQQYADKALMSQFTNILEFCLKFCHRKRAPLCVSSLNSFLASRQEKKKKQNRKFIPCPPIVYKRPKRSPKSAKHSRQRLPNKRPARTVVEELLNRYDHTQLQNINALLRQYQVRQATHTHARALFIYT